MLPWLLCSYEEMASLPSLDMQRWWLPLLLSTSLWYKATSGEKLQCQHRTAGSRAMAHTLGRLRKPHMLTLHELAHVLCRLTYCPSARLHHMLCLHASMQIGFILAKSINMLPCIYVALQDLSAQTSVLAILLLHLLFPCARCSALVLQAAFLYLFCTSIFLVAMPF